MALLKYLLVAVTLVSWTTSLLLIYVPRYSDWSDYFSTGCILTVFICAISALIGRRWRALAIFCFPLVTICLHQPAQWLRATGFRIHVTPIEEYLTKCRIVTFVEDGKQQQVGECEAIATSEITWLTVFYDTSGQLVLPRAQRTKEWKSAVGVLSSPDFYTEVEGRGSPIFGDFYAISMSLSEMQGG